jgi:uncharacterized protein (DUF1330 family)
LDPYKQADLDPYKQYVPLIQASLGRAGGRLVASGQNVVSVEGAQPGVAINQCDSQGLARVSCE